MQPVTEEQPQQEKQKVERPLLQPEDYKYNPGDIVAHVGHVDVENKPRIVIIARGAQQLGDKVSPVYAARVVSVGDKPDFSPNHLTFYEMELTQY